MVEEGRPDAELYKNLKDLCRGPTLVGFVGGFRCLWGSQVSLMVSVGVSGL